MQCVAVRDGFATAVLRLARLGRWAWREAWWQSPAVKNLTAVESRVEDGVKKIRMGNPIAANVLGTVGAICWSVQVGLSEPALVQT